MMTMDPVFAEHFESLIQLLVDAKHAFEDGNSQKALECLSLVIGGCKLAKENSRASC